MDKSSFATSYPGRLEQGPDEKWGLMGFSVGFIVFLFVVQHALSGLGKLRQDNRVARVLVTSQNNDDLFCCGAISHRIEGAGKLPIRRLC